MQPGQPCCGSVRYNNGYQIRAGALNNAATFTNTTVHNYQCLSFYRVRLAASTSAALNNGALTLWIDGLRKQPNGDGQ
jgi:hypothetical protein